jgi:photosystem II stability/assembly factor-like uncharacterized protein
MGRTAPLTVVCLLAFGGSAAATPPGAATRPARPDVRADEPEAAAEHFMLKRQGLAPGDDLVAAWDRGRRHMERMPRYSSRLGAVLPSDAAAKSLSPAVTAVLRTLGSWTPLGPGNIGGRTRTLVVRPDDPDVMLAGGVSGGLWKTTNGGGSWRPVADLLPNIAVNALVMSPHDPDVLYAGTGEGYFREEVRGTWLPLRGEGVYRSTDGGESWVRLPGTAGGDFHWVNDLAVSHLDPDRLYAATRTGVWRSDDAGGSWQHLLDPQVKGGCLDLIRRTDRPTDVVLAACGTLAQATVYRNLEAESGGAWEAVLSDPGMSRTSLAVAPSDQDVMYALSASHELGPDGHFEEGLHAVFRSTDGGASWSATVRNTDPARLNTLLLANPAAASYNLCWGTSDRWVNMGWYCNVIAVDPLDPEVVWAAGVDLFRSDDGGRTWGLASYWWVAEYGYPSFVHADQHVIAFHPGYDGVTNRQMFVGNDGGVFRTDDARARVAYGSAAVCDPAAPATRFVALNHNLGITQFYHGMPYPDGSGRYLGGTQDNGTLMGGDAPGHDGWWPILGGDGGYVAVDPTDTDVVYAEWQWFSFNRSSDGGRSFSPATTGVSDPGFLFITPFVMDPNDPRRLWTGGRRLWRTDSGGARRRPAGSCRATR